MSKRSEMDRHDRGRNKAHTDTEALKHRFGGPGKAPRDGHVDPDDTGNRPGQEQAGSGRDHRRTGESPPKRGGREGPLPEGRWNTQPD